MGDERTCALAVVVVTHDSARWMEGFFRSWRETVAGCGAVGGSSGVPVVVADSGSTDQTVKRVREMAPEAVVIECGNVGYGAAANRGVAEVWGVGAAGAMGGAEWVLICNPDVTFSKGFLAGLMEGVNGIGGWMACVAPGLLNADGTAQPSVGRFPSVWGMVADQFRNRERRKYVWPQPREAGVVEWATGACLLVRRKAFDAVGGFDPKYFLYVEEVDLQRRMRDKKYEAWFLPGVTVVHHSPNAAKAPRREVQRWAALGLLRYFAKFGSGWQLLGFRVLAVVSGRLGMGEAFSSRARIVGRATGP